MTDHVLGNYVHPEARTYWWCKCRQYRHRSLERCPTCEAENPLLEPEMMGEETMSVAEVMESHRPGSYDHDWDAEYADLITRPKLLALMERIRRDGAVLEPCCWATTGGCSTGITASWWRGCWVWRLCR